MRRKCPFISIVTVCKDDNTNLFETLKSTDLQTYHRKEHIVICGDDCNDHILHASKEFSSISHVVIERDQGIYDAMNKGIALCSGMWTIFLNSGDTFADTNTLEKIAGSLENNNIDLFCGTAIFHDFISGEDSLEYPGGIENITKGKMPCFHQSTFCRTTLLKNEKFSLKYKISSDYEFFYRMYLEGKHFEFSDIPISRFRKFGLSFLDGILACAENLEILRSQKANLINEIDFMEYFDPYCGSINRRLNLVKKLNVLLHNLRIIIEKKNKILIYGYGELGQAIEKLIPSHKLVGVIDNSITKRFKNHYPLSEIFNIDFDLIVISTLGRDKKAELTLHDIHKSKIYRLVA